MNALMFPDELKLGDKGQAVQVLQLVLLAMGCNREIIHDGECGNQTGLGLHDLQVRLGVSPTCVFDDATNSALFNLHGINLKSLPIFKLEEGFERDLPMSPP